MRISDLINTDLTQIIESGVLPLIERPVVQIATLDDRTILVDIATVKKLCDFNLGSKVTQELMTGISTYDGYMNPYDIANKLYAMQKAQPGIIRFFKQLSDPNLAPKSILSKLLAYSKPAKWYKQNGIR